VTRVKQAELVAGRVTRPQTVRVWDLAVRTFHWLLVAAMAYEFTFEAGTFVHNAIGYCVLALVVARIVWGFVGSRYARFSEFVKSPAATISYGWEILRGHPPRYVGHNPAGAAMVLTLLFMVALTASTGWAMTTDALWGTQWIEDLHEGAAHVTLGLIVLHVLGVVLASWQHRENLVKAMLTGRKAG